MVSVAAAYALAIAGSFVLYKIVDAVLAIRADEAEETAGLDIVEHGERGYAASVFTGTPSFASQGDLAVLYPKEAES